jgi:hypothetical protein
MTGGILWDRVPRYTLWWLRVWALRLWCFHDRTPRANPHWSLDAQYCRRCGLTAEEIEDHSFAFQPLRWRTWP